MIVGNDYRSLLQDSYGQGHKASFLTLRQCRRWPVFLKLTRTGHCWHTECSEPIINETAAANHERTPSLDSRRSMEAKHPGVANILTMQ